MFDRSLSPHVRLKLDELKYQSGLKYIILQPMIDILPEYPLSLSFEYGRLGVQFNRMLSVLEALFRDMSYTDWKVRNAILRQWELSR